MTAQTKPVRTDASWLEAHWMPFSGNRQFKANPRMIVAGTTRSPGRSGAVVIRSCSGTPSTKASYVDGVPRWWSTPSAVDAST